MHLTLIRHGPTAWNATRRFQGQIDLPLTEEGRAAARAVALALRTERIERIYASDLSRALETARIIARPHRARVLTDARLREFDFGTWEGLTWDEIVRANPHLAGQGSTAAKRYTPEGGESFAQVCQRVGDFLDALARENIQSAAIVTHAGPLHAMISVLGLETAASPRDNMSLRFTPGGITRITSNGGGASLLALNATGHLDAAP